MVGYSNNRTKCYVIVTNINNYDTYNMRDASVFSFTKTNNIFRFCINRISELIARPSASQPCRQKLEFRSVYYNPPVCSSVRPSVRDQIAKSSHNVLKAYDSFMKLHTCFHHIEKVSKQKRQFWLCWLLSYLPVVSL